MNCARNDEIFAKHRAARSETRYYVHEDNSPELIRACEGIFTTHHTAYRSETNGIAAHAVHWVREGTSALLVQSDLSEKWWGEARECFCHLRKIQDKLGGRKVTV